MIYEDVKSHNHNMLLYLAWQIILFAIPPATWIYIFLARFLHMTLH